MEQNPASMLERTLALLCALDDHDLRDRDRLVAKRIVRLSYGEGLTAVFIDQQQDLATFDGIGKGHIKDSLAELVRVKILQVHADKPLYEILPDVANWQVRPRCRYGLEHARQLAASILRQHHDRVGQGDFAGLEATFEQPPTLEDGIGEASRDEAFRTISSSGGASSATPSALCAPGPGAAGAPPQPTPPPGNIRPTETARPRLGLREQVEIRRQVERSLAGAPWQVPETGTLPPAEPAPATVPVPEMGTSGRAGPPEAVPKFPNRELSRARASDDHLPNHLPTHRQQRSSGSADDQGDEGRGDERGGAEWRGQMVRMDDELFADLRRTMGKDLGSFSLEWRRAIHVARVCVAEALEAVKNNRGGIRKHAGGYLKMCFLNACKERGVKLPADLFRRPSAERQVAA